MLKQKSLTIRSLVFVSAYLDINYNCLNKHARTKTTYIYKNTNIFKNFHLKFNYFVHLCSHNSTLWISYMQKLLLIAGYTKLDFKIAKLLLRTYEIYRKNKHLQNSDKLSWVYEVL